MAATRTQPTLCGKLLCREGFRLELAPRANTIGVVHVEHIDRCSAYRRDAEKTTGLDMEMIGPAMGARIEQWRQLTGF